MSSSGLTHNQVFMRNKTVLTSLSLRLQFFVTGIFSTFNVVKLTNNFGASQEPNEKQEYLQMSMAAHAAEAAGLRLGCSRSQRVLRRAAEGSAPPLTGAGERLARLGPGRHPRPHPIPLPRQHLAPTAGQRPRGRQRGTRGTRCHTASLRERARKRAAVGGDGGEKGGRACPSTAQNGSPGPGVRPLGRAGPRSRRGPSRSGRRGRSVLTVKAGPPRRPGRAWLGRPLAPLPQHNGGGARPPGRQARLLPALARAASARAGPCGKGAAGAEPWGDPEGCGRAELRAGAENLCWE